MRPFWRTFRQVASIHGYGQSPSSGPVRKAVTRSSISAQSRLTGLLEMPLIPSAFAPASSTERVETPWI